MSSPKMLFLRWDGFVANAVGELKESQNESEFFDVTVVAGDGGKVQANKLVLGAASTFFFKILKENPDPDPLIYLGGVSSQMLQYLMDFMYTGEVRIHPDDDNDFLDIAVDLRLEGMLGIPASEKTGGEKTKSCSTTPGLPKKRVTFEEISPAPKPPIPPGVAPFTPPTYQNQVSGGVQSPTHTDLSSHQSATSITPVLRHRRHTGDTPGLSVHPHNVHKVTLPPQRQSTAEGAPVIKISHIETPSHYHSTFPEVTSEEKQGTTMFKVELGPANEYNIHYETNEHGDQFIGRFSERRFHKNGAKELSKDQELKDPAITTRAMDFNSEMNIMEDYDDEDYDEDDDHDEDYDPLEDYDPGSGKDYDRMISTRKQDDQAAIPKNDNLIKECYVKIETIKCSKTLATFFKNPKKIPISEIHSGNSAEEKLKTFARHNSIYFGSGSGKYECKLCNKVTINFCGMKSHMEVRHISSNGHRCDICGKVCKSLRTLRSHKKVHSGERPFSCIDCPKTFSQEADLETHKKLHNGGRPYQCSECNKQFSHFAYWKAHNKIHTGERPHKCMDCAKAFFSLYDLNRHMNRKKKCSKKTLNPKY